MATTYDNASLVMIPSGVKESKLYSIKPTDGSGDFTFSRGTDTATRVNASGLIEKERANLLLQSNTFSTTWVTTEVSVTGGQSGYDGSSDAWLLEASSTGVYRRITQSTGGSSIVTNSIYAKAGTTDFIAVSDVGGGGTANVWFDLGNGTIGTIFGSQIIDAKIESVGGGWYRCSATHQGVSPSYALWFVADSDNTTAATIGANVYIQDAQQENSLVATDYIETTTAAVYEGITDNLPRLDYSGGASCPSLLLEPSRTNLITQSEYFGASYWTKSGVSVVDGFTSPEGLSNAYKLVEDSSNGQHFIYSSNSGGSVGNKITTSFFVKADTRSWCRIIGYDGSSVWFDLENGVLGTQTNAIGSIEPLLNDWYKISSTYTSSNASAEKGYLYLATGNNSTTYQGDGTSGIYIYGAQLELGSYPTSYIPTYGTSASRAGDICLKTGISDLIGQTEGTLFFDWIMNHESPNTSEDLYTLSITDGTGNKMIGVNNYNQTLAVFIKDTTTQFFDNSYTGGADGARIKLALAYANNDIALYINGTQIATDSSATIPTLNTIRFNTFWNGNLPDSSSVNQLLLFKTRLTNAELAALTA